MVAVWLAVIHQGMLNMTGFGLLYLLPLRSFQCVSIGVRLIVLSVFETELEAMVRAK